MLKLNDANLINLAADLTKLAIENKMVLYRGTDSVEEVAEKVSTFYKTLLKTLNPDE